MKKLIKGVLRRTGMYAPVRHLYRRLSVGARRERRQNREFYGQLVAGGSLAFDVGANLGQTTEALVACGCRVVSIEPNRKCLPVLRWHFGGDPRVVLVDRAVGPAPGAAVLHLDGTASTASLRADWPHRAPEAETVEVTTLDALIARYGRPDLCKVDVEGYEEEVFAGLSQPVPVICFEMHRKEADRARRVLARLASLGEVTGTNLTGGDNAGWLLDRWVSTADLSARLGDGVPLVANVVVKMAAR